MRCAIREKTMVATSKSLACIGVGQAFCLIAGSCASLMVMTWARLQRPGRNGNDDEGVGGALSGDECGAAGSLALGADLCIGHERRIKHDMRWKGRDDAIVVGHDVLGGQH